MIWLAAVPLIVGLALLGSAPELAARMTPSTAVRVLTGLALTVALCTGLVLSAAAVLVCAQISPLPSLGGWSARALRAGMGFPTVAGFVALIVVIGCLSAAIVRVIASIRSLTAAAREVRRLRPTIGDLVLIDDDVPAAYSVGARHGRIVVSSAMLGALDADERCALIAHEASHLRHRHQLYVHLAEVATAANPLLRPVSTTVRRAVERWADEDAAVETGDRTIVARAIAKAALATSGRTGQRVGLAIADDRVVDRVQLMLLPARAHRRLIPLSVVTIGLITWATTIALAAWANNLVQLAEAVHAHH